MKIRKKKEKERTMEFRIREREISIKDAMVFEICNYFNLLRDGEIRWGYNTKRVIEQQSHEKRRIVSQNKDIWKNILRQYFRESMDSIKTFYNFVWEITEELEARDEINTGEYVNIANNFKQAREASINLKQRMERSFGWKISNVTEQGVDINILEVEIIPNDDTDSEADSEDDEDSADVDDGVAEPEVH